MNFKIIKALLVLIASITLFVLYSFLPLSQLTDGLGRSVSMKFDTPDEMINYTFAVNFAERSGLYYVDLVNAFLPESIVFPRWARPERAADGTGGFMYPGTFWGLIMLFGGIAKIVGKSVVVPFLTPVFALGCVALMYGLSKQLFNRSTAMWSAFSLACFPVFVYYSSRTMFHTILFIFFWLLGIYCYIKAFDEENQEESRINPPAGEAGNQESRNVKSLIAKMLFVIHDSKFIILYYLSAISFGLALFVRFADAILVLMTIVLLFIWNRADFKRMVIFVCLLAVTLVPIGLLNHVSYGSPFDFGLNGGNEIGITSSDHSWVQSVASLILPFGFHPRVMWNVVWNVLLKSYWWFWIPSIAGYWILVKRYWNQKRREVIVSSIYYLLSSVYLVSLYGSWNFSDSVVANTFPISSSYFRYFLPLFTLAVPFVGYMIAQLFDWFKNHVSRITWYALNVGVIGVLIVLSFQLAYLGDEGLLRVRRQVLAYRQIALEAKKTTNQEDIILVKRGEDKMIFPDRYHVVNVDYIPAETVERVLKSFKGTVWEIRAEKFLKVK